MSLQTLDLDPLHLTYHVGRLRLSANSSAEFKLPPDAAPHQVDLAKALASGSLWVGHARVCRVDIYISLNDRPLNAETHDRVVESLGYRILGANLWSQLSLSPSLETTHSDDLKSAQSDLSIILSQSPRTSVSTDHPRGWILDNVDVKAPPSVLSLQFNKLQVRLDFYTIQDKAPRAAKRLKMRQEELDSMLLDRLEDVEKSQLEVFEEAEVARTHNLLSPMAGCLGQWVLPPPECGKSPFDIASFHSSPLQEPVASLSADIRNRHEPKKPTDKRLCFEQAKIKLQTWLDMNSKNPYPTNHEKLRLMEDTGLQRKQLNAWFYRARGLLAQSMDDEQNKYPMLLEHTDEKHQLLNPPAALRQDHILIHNIDQDNIDRNILSTEQWELEDNDNMLSFRDDTVPSLESQTSTQISMTSTNSSVTRKRAPSSQTSIPNSSNLSLSCSSMLTSAAVNILIGGSACKRSLHNITLENAFPKAPLSVLAPALFCPGFKQIMAHNSRFLPTISQAISSSWVRNCQGPGLRAKLLALANAPPPGTYYGHSAQSGDPGSVERLRAVVQVRLWSMMQRKLSDPTTAEKLKWEIFDPSGLVDQEDFEWDEALLRSGDVDDRLNMNQIASPVLDLFIEEELTDEDDELLFDPVSDDEGLISYFDEMEQLEVEKHTDEMLFRGGDWEDEDDSKILLSDGNNEETMLL